MGGHRVTAHQPNRVKQHIYLVGGCCIFGVGASDAHTIASWLQSLFNEYEHDTGRIVQNYGCYLSDLEGMQMDETFGILESLPVHPGDIVLWNTKQTEDLLYIDLSDLVRCSLIPYIILQMVTA